MNTVAIIGAGVTGLTAAFRLRQRGVPGALFEASPRVGGVIQSVARDGYLAEFGPNTILETSPKIPELVGDLGLESRRLYSSPQANNRYLVRYGQAIALPGSLIDFATTPLFSARAKLRLVLEPFIHAALPDIEESVGEFVLRRLGPEFLDYAINPLVAGVYAGDPRRLSVKEAFPKLHALEQKYGSLILGQVLGARERKRRGTASKQNAPKFSFDRGLQVLTDTLRESIGDALQLGTPVTRLVRTGNGWTVTAKCGEREVEQQFSAVLLTAPAHKLADIRLCGQATGPKAGAALLPLAPLREIVHPPVASIVLGFRRRDVDHPLDGFGVLVPEAEKLNILGAIFSSSLFPHRAPSGHVTLTAYIGGMRAPELALRSPGELIERTCADLRTLLGIHGTPTFEHTTLFRHAIPQYEVGYGRFKNLMTELESDWPGLFFAGNYRDGISLSDSIVSGNDVPERIATFLASHSRDITPVEQKVEVAA
jgi:protoporphyrinogen/coproporphyrinogen III oxidase